MLESISIFIISFFYYYIALIRIFQGFFMKFPHFFTRKEKSFPTAKKVSFFIEKIKKISDYVLTSAGKSDIIL